MPRVPLLAGSRVVVAEAGDDDVVLQPPPPGPAVADVAAAVRDALRFPLAGPPLEALATRGGRATVVVEPPALPIPTALRDPRAAATAVVVEELERTGMPSARQTLLVAGGLARRVGRHELESLVTPDLARAFRGRVEVHDAEGDLVDVASGPPALRVHRALVDADLVVAVTAAETVLHGGPAALLAAADAASQRASAAESLLEAGSAPGWRRAVALERALARRTPLLGVSLALNHPRFAGVAYGYPYDEAALERIAASPARRLYGLLPAPLRARVLHALRAETTASAVFAGPPSVAHAEALLRAIDGRSAPLAAPLAAVCLGIPRVTPFLPRERPNPLLAAYLGLGLALRLWRDAPPLAPGGTIVLVHRFVRHFVHPTQQPYRTFFAAARQGRDPAALAAAERAAAADERAVATYRSGASCHPLLPFADWAACAPALARAGSVLVAGCRDAGAARQLGFVPVHALAPALTMAREQAGSRPIGFLVAPPYFPVRTGEPPG
ncbi:MAG: DUF2088 domain-containing protein [Thermoleophilia bacterium]|nr:DUF2088 domain-containing protein [Thermoleophilia bacterium]